MGWLHYARFQPLYYRNLLKEFILFLRFPHLNPGQKSTQAKSTDTVGLFVLKMVFTVGEGIFFALISPFYDPQNLAKSSMADRFSPTPLLLVAGILRPLLEETLF